MKALLIALMCTISLQVIAQKSLTDSLNERIDSLESALQEKNYSRIPIGDLDKNLNVHVQSEVYNAFYKYLAVLGLILFGGGFGIYRSLQSELKKQVDESVKDNNEANKNSLKDLAETQNRENNRQDILIKAITDSVSTISSKQESFLSDVTADVEKKISEATQMIWNDIADNKLRTAREANYVGGLLAKELNEFLDNDSVVLTMEKKQLLVDALMRCFYVTPEAEIKSQGYGKKYDEMIELLKKYESKIDLLPETYVNAAIALTNNYEYYKNDEDKRLSIDCCDKALLKLKDYGIPFVLKLEIYSIDYKKAYDQSEKNVSLDQLRRVFHAISSNQSGALLFEAIDRLRIDKAVPYLKPYLELLEDVCCDEMLALKEKAARYFITPQVMKLDAYRNLFFDLISEGSSANTQMNGTWKARTSVNAGVESKPGDVAMEIIINDYEYSQKDGTDISTGYIHYLPFTAQTAINLYVFNEAKEYVQTIFCISKIQEDGSWKLCSNYNSDERPSDFISTPENKYYLDELVKV
jgi:hypothetical protein